MKINKIVNYFCTIHNFGYYKGWNIIEKKFVDFASLPKNQKKRIAKINKRIFQEPCTHTFRDFKEVQLLYLGENLLF